MKTRQRDPVGLVLRSMPADSEFGRPAEGHLAVTSKVSLELLKEVETARLNIETQAEQAAELERLRAALAEAQRGRIASEQQAAVLGARLEAMTDRTTRGEARVEALEKQLQEAGQELSSARIQVQAQQMALDCAAWGIEAAKRHVEEARSSCRGAW